MVVHHYHIERKIRPLPECAPDCIGYGPFAVQDRDDDRSLHRKNVPGHLRRQSGCRKICSYALEMQGTSLLHFELYSTV